MFRSFVDFVAFLILMLYVFLDRLVDQVTGMVVDLCRCIEEGIRIVDWNSQAQQATTTWDKLVDLVLENSFQTKA